MDLRLIFFCTTIGALVGTIVGVLLMNRKIRLPITGADLAALRGKLETAESSLATATASLEGLQKQIAERDQTIQQNADELKKQQERFDLALASAEKDKAQRSGVEQRSQELNAEIATLKELRGDAERKLEEAIKLAAEQYDAQKRQIQALTEQVSGLLAESAALSRFREQESLHRTSLEAQLSGAHQRVEQLTQQISELEKERSQFDNKLQEERLSAARGMELLVMAQENFSRVLKQVPANGNGHVVKAVAISEEEHSEMPDGHPVAAD
ncbi:MAG: hypothetical protein LAP40_06100 [Acidobacteriia bacterium]|nr:hypothetical protein [Terriglobia bacterium]